MGHLAQAHVTAARETGNDRWAWGWSAGCEREKPGGFLRKRHAVLFFFQGLSDETEDANLGAAGARSGDLARARGGGYRWARAG